MAATAATALGGLSFSLPPRTWRTGSDACYSFAGISVLASQPTKKVAFSENGEQVERSATTAPAGTVERPRPLWLGKRSRAGFLRISGACSSTRDIAVQKFLISALQSKPSFPHALRNLLNARRAIATGAWSGIAKTELTLISHRT